MTLQSELGSRPPLHDYTHWTHHTLEDPSGRTISPTQRPLPDNTQHSQETDIHAPEGFEPAIPESKRPQTEALDRSSTGISK